MKFLRLCLVFFVTVLLTAQASAIEIPLEKEGGVYSLPVRINGVITLNFILDTGASEVSIPADVFLTLLRTGTIKQSDVLPEITGKLADGSKAKYQRFVIRELELGGMKISNVPGIVSPPAGDLLLGQTLLQRLDSWSLDNKRHVLIVGPAGSEMKQSDNKPALPPSQTGFSAADEESIKRLTTRYYDSVQKKDIEGAMNCYATEKRPQIKRSRIEAVAKDTEYYKIESITVLLTETDKAQSITMLSHKKHDLPPESWKITLELIKENGEWKIWSTPGQRSSLQSGSPSGKSIIYMPFGAFKFISSKEIRDGRDCYPFQLYKGNLSVYNDDNNVIEPKISTLKFIPDRTCESAITYLFLGGAHCCTTGVLVSICDRQEKAFVIQLAHTDSEHIQFVDANKDGIHQMSVLDWTFAYYSANENLGLCFASSPAFRRLLVFEREEWRPDQHGQFAQYYAEQMQKTEDQLKQVRGKSAEYDDEKVALAIEKAYYALMAGNSDIESETILNKDLPYAWQSVRHKVFTDVKNSVLSFEPVKRLQ
jgi:hypothetical protein